MNSAVIFPILDKTSFLDILSLSQVNKDLHKAINNETYWSARSRMFNIEYLHVLSLDPKTRYAWSLVCHFIEEVSCGKENPVIPDHRDVILYLSKRSDLLFPGLELVIGLDTFMKRCIISHDTDLIKYCISLGLDCKEHKIFDEYLGEKLYCSIRELIVTDDISGLMRLAIDDVRSIFKYRPIPIRSRKMCDFLKSVEGSTFSSFFIRDGILLGGNYRLFFDEIIDKHRWHRPTQILHLNVIPPLMIAHMRRVVCPHIVTYEPGHGFHIPAGPYLIPFAYNFFRRIGMKRESRILLIDEGRLAIDGDLLPFYQQDIKLFSST